MVTREERIARVVGALAALARAIWETVLAIEALAGA